MFSISSEYFLVDSAFGAFTVFLVLAVLYAVEYVPNFVSLNKVIGASVPFNNLTGTVPLCVRDNEQAAITE
ncbi:hypothetical protein T4C_5165 [Trichinella pseudospiralis]|uniref:Uncharacterized protein n=1 Tax=Trichinella pseudospiralis TaxID=6337 RepID=A0A0V1JW94_TRIPS|nr:hypothetical protein T4C_5165 [Trichinella pseudospiralis]